MYYTIVFQITETTKYSRMLSTELCLASSKILTPHPPSRPSECVLPLHQRRGVYSIHSPGGEGSGGSIFWNTTCRHRIGLLQYSLSTTETNKRIDEIVHCCTPEHIVFPQFSEVLKMSRIIITQFIHRRINTKNIKKKVLGHYHLETQYVWQNVCKNKN
jgi:hypothetical protein